MYRYVWTQHKGRHLDVVRVIWFCFICLLFVISTSALRPPFLLEAGFASRRAFLSNSFHVLFAFHRMSSHYIIGACAIVLFRYCPRPISETTMASNGNIANIVGRWRQTVTCNLCICSCGASDSRSLFGGEINRYLWGANRRRSWLSSSRQPVHGRWRTRKWQVCASSGHLLITTS